MEESMKYLCYPRYQQPLILVGYVIVLLGETFPLNGIYMSMQKTISSLCDWILMSYSHRSGYRTGEKVWSSRDWLALTLYFWMFCFVSVVLSRMEEMVIWISAECMLNAPGIRPKILHLFTFECVLLKERRTGTTSFLNGTFSRPAEFRLQCLSLF